MRKWSFRVFGGNMWGKFGWSKNFNIGCNIMFIVYFEIVLIDSKLIISLYELECIIFLVLCCNRELCLYISVFIVSYLKVC